jgi:hypothetical protein
MKNAAANAEGEGCLSANRQNVPTPAFLYFLFGIAQKESTKEKG